jgi:hypothetical protein
MVSDYLNVESQLVTILSATVCRAQDIIGKQVMAIKLESINRQPSYLEHEYTVLNELQDGVGLP